MQVAAGVNAIAWQALSFTGACANEAAAVIERNTSKQICLVIFLANFILIIPFVSIEKFMINRLKAVIKKDLLRVVMLNFGDWPISF